MMGKDVCETYGACRKRKKRKFLRAVEKDNAANKSDILKLINDIRETRFSEALAWVGIPVER